MPEPALAAEGFDLHALADDTQSYAYTVRDWALGLERARDGLAVRFGERTVRAFLLFLRASERFLETNRTQAYHLVAGRAAAANAATTHATAKRSPTRP